MWSASSLVANCAYVNVLKKARPPTPAQQESMDRGTAFHQAIEKWLRDGMAPTLEDLEIDGWLQLLAAHPDWNPDPAMRTEIAWGLTPEGEHTHVIEPRPHVYESLAGDALLTAGRADVVWLAFDRIVRVLDWKTGRWPVAPAAENLQVNAAGIALAKRWRARGYQPGIYYARDGYFDWGEPVALGSAAHERAFAAVKAAAELDELPRPGSWCGACWERSRCHAAPTTEAEGGTPVISRPDGGSRDGSE